MSERKIIHIDMDAFYASVELREQPHLKGLPVVVAWEGARSVVCAASYEARQFGLHSAMSALTAKRLCPQAVFIPPHFDLYRRVSAQIHAVFRRHTDLIEPLSLDEAYLDVTANFQNIPYASEVARTIRAEILEETGLTASAGVAPNKFLAKIASDWRKPNGQFVLPPQKVPAFLDKLPLGKIPGVGKVTLKKMQSLGMHTAGDLKGFGRGELVHYFGRYGYRLYDLARGIDERPVQPRAERLQISTEITLPEDIPLQMTLQHLPHLAEDLWRQIQRKNVDAKSVTLKLKTHDFRIITRSLTYSSALPDSKALLQAAYTLAQRVPPQTEDAFRLIGIGVSHLLPKNQQQSLWL
ncbi:DNA polymerase IV [Neisseria animalis]|uniref:DNA polymerase IV n=1 Tax=Neisseria animalis TaxID=492 RepID=A0A5P3MP05_NEIAN|nr:DNA polymerase IV [Neisseria animalis]QEY23228.1 DNA polymerase IV [Neisseria animalis]ROW31802.1 DNA polymerase IV [Neisseria animalis]VEE08437.1 DNA polymerase IV [Neisseria animalis]